MPYETAAAYRPRGTSLSSLRRAAAGCRGCDLYERATQTVFGEGSRHARIVLVGEQPGDREDVEGEPFVGPAGAMLRSAIEEAGIDPAAVYVTNAVKHFRFVVRGKRRIHQKPRTIEIEACKPWLDAEFAAVKPRTIVAMGTTAARSVLGRAVRIGDRRGQPVTASGRTIFVTVHPASVLRQRDGNARRAVFARFVADLRAAGETLFSGEVGVHAPPAH